jgi:hypothetical protein
MRAHRFSAIISVCAVISCSSRVLATVYNIPPDAVPATTVSGDVINLNVGGSFPPSYSMAAGTTLNVDGGIFSPTPVETPFHTFGDVNIYSTTQPGPLEVDGGDLNVFGGSIFAVNVGGNVNLFDGHISTLFIDSSTFKMQGGLIDLLDTPFESQVEILGGEISMVFDPVGSKIQLRDGKIGVLESASDASVYMTGGAVDRVSNFFDSLMQVSGGQLSSDFSTLSGLNTELHLIGTEFQLNGQPIPGLLPGQSVVVPQRNVNIDGVLLDGSSVSLFLSTDMMSPQYFAEDATLRLTLVPEATTAFLAVQTCWPVVLIRRRKAK